MHACRNNENIAQEFERKQRGLNKLVLKREKVRGKVYNYIIFSHFK